MSDPQSRDEQEPKALTNVDLVVFALAELGEGERTCHLEDVAVRVFEYSPGSFRWDLDRYADRVDKDKVRVSLTDAQKARHGTLARAVGPKRPGVSKPTDAWQLTAEGAEWFLGHRDEVSRRLDLALPVVKKGKADQIRRRVLGSDLYQAYASEGAVPHDPYGFADLLECSPDAKNAVVQERFDALSNQVQLLQDLELIAFLRAASQVHSDMLLVEHGRTE